MNKISVVLVEDHDLTRIGLIASLEQSEEIKVVNYAKNGYQGLKILTETKPDVAIIDIGLPDIDGIELTQKLKEFQADLTTEKTRVLILTMQSNQDSVLGAFAAGADSYSLKNVSIENLIQAIKVTYEGDSWIDPAIARVVLQEAKNKKAQSTKNESMDNDSSSSRLTGCVDSEYQQILESDPLTERQLEVLELIVAGCNNSQIADKLYITVGTVKTHVRTILNKLCVDDRTQAAVRALRSGLVD